MGFANPNRMVVHGLGLPYCPIPIAENGNQTVRVSMSDCCVKKISPCIAQGADKTFSFTDSVGVDYSLAQEITFDVWESVGGASLIAKSLTGGSISLIADNIFTTNITDVESGALTAGGKYCEAWVTLGSGLKRMVGAGQFRVIDTRKFD